MKEQPTGPKNIPIMHLKSLILLLTTAAFSVMAEQGAAKKTSGASSSASKSETAQTSEDELTEGPKSEPRVAAVSSIDPEVLEGFENYAPQVQQLVRDALALTKLNLTYTFGSSNPKQGGMDCSGTIVHLLNGLGLKGVPRQSNEICGWVQNNTLLHRTEKADSLKHPEFASLQPGDLLFWSGTYETSPRAIPVTHVMLYLGKMKKTGRPLMFGASDGRVYQGEKRTGVSVFDLTIPKETSKSKFYGYGLIPGVGRIVPKVVPEPVIAEAPAKPSPPPPPLVVAEVETSKPSPPENKETVMKAITLSETSSTKPTETVVKPTDKPSSPSKAAESSTAKPKSTTTTAKARPKSSPSKTTTKSGTTAKKSQTTTRKTAPAPATPQDKLRQAAKGMGDSIRNAISR